jgi:hypothetical protein
MVDRGRADRPGSQLVLVSTGGALIYRWDGKAWNIDGRIPRLRYHLDANAWGGWFISVPATSPSAVAFELVGSCCTDQSDSGAHSSGVITNSGGRWHLEPI